ncbi:E3 ubiquitin-protein ligase TRIM23-like [Fopius arisanus]|uniref:RING-type E3 ubiquitin transferase n=1 Tax=Fopius arisanus TaxID=64838 RepID=A0A0C9QPI4_9HYME|nr:PREDICTED: E3 ubiquitin-protein ligase TRIM23-like [Fopius arisanus]
MTESNRQFSKYLRRSVRSLKTNVLECGICEEVFCIEGDKVPRLLQCGHTVCHSCLLRLQPCISEVQFLFCPFDRQPTEVTSREGVHSLKKNFALIELLERLEQSRNENSSTLERERLQSTQPCDEDDSHFAVIYCTVCSTHLCEACDTLTHSSKTLGKHRRIPLSEKPKEKPKCPIHTNHIAEFTCIQEGCENALMCYLCKDYGRHSAHKLALVEIEAESLRKSIVLALQKMTQFMESMKDTSHRIEVVIQELEGWAIEDARYRVEHHFDELRLQLAEQEKNALTCVDDEMKGRQAALRQQLQDLTSTRSQVADVCIQCENILDNEDWKLLSGAEKVQEVLGSLEQQQQKYAQLGPDFLTPEASIPIIFSRDNRVHIQKKIYMRVVILGLDGAGKTSILSAMKGITLTNPPISTIGFNVESLEYENLVITLWDVGGQHKFRPLWKHYYHNAQAVIFVVDASDRSRFEEAQNELAKIVSERHLRDAVVLIYANKQDVEGSASIEELTDILSLQKLCCGRAWHIEGSSPLTDANTSTQGLQWLTQQLGAHGYTELNLREKNVKF